MTNMKEATIVFSFNRAMVTTKTRIGTGAAGSGCNQFLV